MDASKAWAATDPALRPGDRADDACRAAQRRGGAYRVAAALALAATCLPARAAGCDELRQSIEARIRANGVESFTVTVVDAAASAPGKVVGTCEQQRKKLVYLRGAAVAPAPASAPVAASSARPAPAVITECADGRVITQGTCKK